MISDVFLELTNELIALINEAAIFSGMNFPIRMEKRTENILLSNFCIFSTGEIYICLLSQIELIWISFIPSIKTGTPRIIQRQTLIQVKTNPV